MLLWLRLETALNKKAEMISEWSWSSTSMSPHKKDAVILKLRQSFTPLLSSHIIFFLSSLPPCNKEWKREHRAEPLSQSIMMGALLSGVLPERWESPEIINKKLIRQELASSSKTRLIHSRWRGVHHMMVQVLTASTKYQEQHNGNMGGVRVVRGEVTSYFQIWRKKTFKMFVLEPFFWLMFNLSLFQSNVLVISSIAEGHI